MLCTSDKCISENKVNTSTLSCSTINKKLAENLNRRSKAAMKGEIRLFIHNIGAIYANQHAWKPRKVPKKNTGAKANEFGKINRRIFDRKH